MEVVKSSFFTQMLESKIRIKLNEIAEELLTRKAELNGVLTGKSGISLFLFYYSRFSGETRFHNGAYDILNESIEGFSNSDNLSFGFCGSLPGLGWAINHLNKIGFIDETPDDVFDGFDDLVWASVMRFLRNKNYDFLHGGNGNFLYLLSTELTEQKVNYFLDLLESFSIQSDNEVKWDSLISNRDNIRGYNISVSHGMSSTLEILRLCHSKGLAKDRCKSLGYKIINFIKTQDNSTKKLGSFFRNYQITTGEKKEDARTRLAWCYGDLGVAYMLLKFAREMEDIPLENYALGVLIDCAERRFLRVTHVNDACVCHGSSGVAHMFRKLYEKTQNETFLLASSYWYEKTLDLCDLQNGVAGYQYWRPDSEGGPTLELGILEGVAGVGLVLLYALCPEIGDWDQSLLLS